MGSPVKILKFCLLEVRTQFPHPILPIPFVMVKGIWSLILSKICFLCVCPCIYIRYLIKSNSKNTGKIYKNKYFEEPIRNPDILTASGYGIINDFVLPYTMLAHRSTRVLFDFIVFCVVSLSAGLYINNIKSVFTKYLFLLAIFAV